MSNGIEIRWADSTHGEIVNSTGHTLHRVRAQVVGETRIQGRKTWTVDVDHWAAGAVIRLVRVELRGATPQIRMRFTTDEPTSRRVNWYTDLLPLDPPLGLEEEDPWSLGARTRPQTRAGA